jgi:hypothetical protein
MLLLYALKKIEMCVASVPNNEVDFTLQFACVVHKLIHN